MALGEQFDVVLTAARAGAEWAWERIYQDLSPVVLGYMRGQRAGHPEDVTSEIFLQVVRDLDSFQGDESSFRSWVFTIAHHRLVDARRKASRRPSEPADAVELDRHLPPDEAEDAALALVTTHEIRELLDVLTPDQRSVLLLRLLGGLTISEIAPIVDKRPGAVKALQRRGLATLRSELQDRAYPLVGGVTLTEMT